MTKDEAEAIHALARQLLEEDVSVETRCRLARRIIEHARTIKAACMAEPAIKYGGNRQTGVVNAQPPESPVIFEPVTYSYEFAADIPQQSIWDGIKTAYLNGRQVFPQP